AGNIDVIFIVTSLNQNFNLSRIERALALAYDSGATPVILLSKSDLCEDAPAKIAEVERIAFGVPVIQFSNITGQNIDAIRGMIKPGQTACLIGSSGVGKTTLTNTLCGLSDKTIEIRAKDGRGRHATTGRALHPVAGGGMIIDTPGIREIGLLDNAASLEEMYGGMEELISKCRFGNCTHANEPGCAVRAAIENGELDERQFKNYVKMQTENRWATDSAGARRAKQERNKAIAKLVRRIKG
ncbi:MAG: ribosome small subunit-dependent GTPase A, partial [Rickettsiales bacterium]|nr:ribosome small subunit-dependent GTPase A [Rickettsiales bacterium]